MVEAPVGSLPETGRPAAGRPRDDPAPPIEATVAIWSGFLLHGIVTVLVGPLIPELRPTWGVERAVVAWLFPAQFLASSIGSALSTRNAAAALVVGYGSFGVGLAFVAVVPWPGPLVAMACLGLGLGLVAPATNLHVAHAAAAAGGPSAGRVSTLNFVWGVGAVACPLLFAAVRGRASLTWLTWTLAVLSLGLASFLAVRLRGVDLGPTDVRATSPQGFRWAQITMLLPFAGLLLCYVGVESATGGWLVAFAEQLAHPDRGFAGSSFVEVDLDIAPLLVGSVYWAALLAGRLFAPLVLRKVPEPALFAFALSVAATGCVVLMLAGSLAAAALGGALVGLGLAPLFPLIVSFLAAATHADGSRSSGWVFAFCGLGGALVPWLTGRVAEGRLLAVGYTVPFTALLAMGALFALLRKMRESMRESSRGD